MYEEDGGQLYHHHKPNGGETFVFRVDDERSHTHIPPLGDYRDAESTRAHAEMIRAQYEARERRLAFELEVSRHLTKMPRELTLPAAYFLAKKSPEEIVRYEEMYRYLDTQLKDLLRRQNPDVSLPSFDDILTSAQPGILLRAMHKEVRNAFYLLLTQRTFSEMVGLLDLFGAFAENIQHAKHIQAHPEAEM